MASPLEGLRVIEMAGIGPGPFACMLLADMGAEVIRVDRTSGGMSMGQNPADVMARGRKSIAVDLKNPEGVEVVLKLVESAQVIIEGFRPGVMEKLGLGPDVCMARNKGLVYGRMTGWGQDGPLAHSAGHDINYIALTGALHATGTKPKRTKQIGARHEYQVVTQTRYQPTGAEEDLAVEKVQAASVERIHTVPEHQRAPRAFRQRTEG